MPRRSGESGPPNSFLARGGRWPEGPFRKSAPAAVPFVAHVAARLRAELDERGMTVAAVAEGIGVHKPTLYDVLNGNTYLDTHTLAALERFLNASLWPAP